MYTHSFVNTETQQFIIGLDFYTRACLDFWIEKVRGKKKTYYNLFVRLCERIYAIKTETNFIQHHLSLFWRRFVPLFFRDRGL